MDSDLPRTLDTLYPPGGPYTYDTAHTPYIAAVATAVRSAGVGVDSWGAGKEIRRDGFLDTADYAQADNRGYCFRWTEVYGWSYGYDHGGGELITLAYFGGEPLPDPETVATTIARIMAGEETSVSSATPPGDGYGYRNSCLDIDFEERLAAYRTHPGADGSTI